MVVIRNYLKKNISISVYIIVYEINQDGRIELTSNYAHYIKLLGIC